MIHVFIVNDDDEICSYKPIAEKHGINLYIGPLGLHHMRNFITGFFPQGCRILNMDDDIKKIVYMEEDTTVIDVKSSKRYPVYELTGTELVSWIEGAFATLELGQAHMFGVYPVRNGYFMKDMPYMTTDLRFCVGTMWGCLNDHDIRINIEEKEDFERTLLQYVKYGSVHRYNHIAPVTSYYVTPGGMQSRSMDRSAASKDSCEYLVCTFPKYCKKNRMKKNGIYEVKLLHS